MMIKLVVIGASQGGVIPLQTIVKGLPRDFRLPVLIVLHTGPTRSLLPSIFNDLGGLPASHARNGELLEPGHVYVAPPDFHMLVGKDRIELSHGPRENWARPAIDPLFRTAAESYGPEVVGIVLSGRLNDGTIGLYEIKRRGGIAIVQDPAEAEADSMPKSVMENVSVDYCVSVDEMPGLLVKLAETEMRVSPPSQEQSAAYERSERPVALICPDCGGAMREESIGTITRFRCHIGHTMTAEVMAMAELENLEHSFASIFRALKERAELCTDMAQKHEAAGNRMTAEAWRDAGEQALGRESTIRNLLEAEWLHPEDGTGSKT
jgi:two-component system chemotaxis response regulator CheB